MTKKSNFKGKNESLLIAARNNATKTHYIKARIDKTQRNRRCRSFGDTHETINHIITEHGKLAPKEYKVRYGCMDEVIHFKLSQKV